MSVVLDRCVKRVRVTASSLLILLGFCGGGANARTEAPAAVTAPGETIEPSAFLQQQMQLQQLNSQVEQELLRIQAEARIETARRELEQAREGQMPELRGTFRIGGRAFAEFAGQRGVVELTVGEHLVGDWRIAEIHVDHVRLCRSGSRQCRVLTPTQAASTAPLRAAQ